MDDAMNAFSIKNRNGGLVFFVAAASEEAIQALLK